jgi:hypothetical protein
MASRIRWFGCISCQGIEAFEGREWTIKESNRRSDPGQTHSE